MSLLEESTKYPVKGDKVDREDKANNDKAVSDITKSVEKYDGGPREHKRPDRQSYKYDPNKTTLDVRFDYDPGDEYRERVRLQVGGFNSKAEKDRKVQENEEEPVDRTGNEAWLDDQEEKSKKLNTRHVEIKHSGFQTNNLPKSYVENETMFKESKAMKRLHFKNTIFLSEEQMLKRVPDAYKVDGNKFIMRDASGTDYMVECKVDEDFGYKQLNVINKINKQSVNEELGRMRDLYGYRSEDNRRGTESGDMSELLETVRRANKGK